MLFKILAAVFGFFVRLYPAYFRDEFGDELKSVFEAMLKDALCTGGMSVAVVCLLELRDLPINLLRAHLEKKHMLRILHSQPVRFAWKGALGFGLSFVAVNLIWNELTNWFFTPVIFKPLFNWFLQPQYQILFRMIFGLIPLAIGSMIGGLLFAAFFAEKGQFRKFTFLGATCWFIPGLLFFCLNFFIVNYTNAIENVRFALSGSLLGLIMGLITNIKKKQIGLLIAGGILYPVLINFFYGQIWYISLSASTPLDHKYQVFYPWIAFTLAGISFGILMGLILGWGRKDNPVTQLS